MSGFTLSGGDALRRKLRKNATMDDVKKAVKVNGAELQRKMTKNASFTQGYQTGTTKRSIGLTIEDNGLTARVGPTTEYSPYLEYGTRFMAAQPFVKPAFFMQKVDFLKDLSRILK